MQTARSLLRSCRASAGIGTQSKGLQTLKYNSSQSVAACSHHAWRTPLCFSLRHCSPLLPLLPLSYKISHRHLSYDVNQELVRVVKEELKSAGDKRARQLQLISAIASDVSEPTTQLISKLNCEAKLSGEEMFELAAAMFAVRNKVALGAAEIAVALFEHAGEELTDHNSLYTFAQLLRTGQGCTMDTARAAKIFTDLAMKGHPYAQFALAGLYYSGSGVEQSFTRAFTLYKVSAQNFVPQAYNILGEMYRHGLGVKENIEEAVSHYRKGVEVGDGFAHLSLAHCYTHGKGVEQSYEKAFEHHIKASESGNPMALYNIGGHYFSGKGVELSFKMAAEYYQKAASQGFAPAQVNLGNMYYAGLGVSKDMAKAKELYQLAAEGGDKNAKLLLEELELEEQKVRDEEEEDKERPGEDDKS